MVVEKMMTGDLYRINADNLCIKKGAVVRVTAVDADNIFREKGLKGSATCVSVDDRSISGGIWAAYLDPIPLTEETIAKNEFEKYSHFYRLSVSEEYDYWCVEVSFYYSGVVCVDAEHRRDDETIADIFKKISYFHELQHIFSELELNKIIIL